MFLCEEIFPGTCICIHIFGVAVSVTVSCCFVLLSLWLLPLLLLFLSTQSSLLLLLLLFAIVVVIAVVDARRENNACINMIRKNSRRFAMKPFRFQQYTGPSFLRRYQIKKFGLKKKRLTFLRVFRKQ